MSNAFLKHFTLENKIPRLSIKRIALLGLLQALGTSLYIGLYLALHTFLDSFRDPEVYDDPFDVTLMTVVIWAMFVTSVCTLGALVLGYPAKLLWNGRTREAFTLVAATALWLVLMLVSVIIVIA